MPFGVAPINDSHFNMDGLLNFNNYADGASWNPYVVGSDAYNYAHGLTGLSPQEAAAAETPVSPVPAATLPTGSGNVPPANAGGSDNLPWLVLIALGLLLLVK